MFVYLVTLAFLQYVFTKQKAISSHLLVKIRTLEEEHAEMSFEKNALKKHTKLSKLYCALLVPINSRWLKKKFQFYLNVCSFPVLY